jgi:protein-L-isoaspartate(D-aspartate) O-methyltransferase
MSEMLKPSPNLRVLEIGTGSGYQAAVLSRLFREVYSIEIVPGLAKLAESNLRAAGVSNVHVRIGDGYDGWPEKAPFDRILLTAAPPEVPASLLDQLARGGRLVAPEGADVNAQYLVTIEKDSSGRLHRSSGDAVRFVPMVPGPVHR